MNGKYDPNKKVTWEKMKFPKEQKDQGNLQNPLVEVFLEPKRGLRVIDREKWSDFTFNEINEQDLEILTHRPR